MSLPPVGPATGLILSDVKRGTTGGGDRWANCVVRFTGYKPDGNGGWTENSHVVATIAAYGDLAAQLVSFAKGDEIALTGKIRELTVWTPPQGEARPSLSITLTEVRAVEPKPRGGKRTDRAPDVYASGPDGTPRRGQPPAPARQPEPAGAQVLDFRRTAADRLRRAHANSPAMRRGSA